MVPKSHVQHNLCCLNVAFAPNICFALNCEHMREILKFQTRFHSNSIRLHRKEGMAALFFYCLSRCCHSKCSIFMDKMQTNSALNHDLVNSITTIGIKKGNRLKTSPAKDVCEFFEETEQDFLKKKTQQICSDKRSFMFWGAIQSDGGKLLVKVQTSRTLSVIWKC